MLAALGTNTWSYVASYPTAIIFTCVCTVNGHVYSFGGMEPDVIGFIAESYVYSETVNAWAQVVGASEINYVHRLHCL